MYSQCFLSPGTIIPQNIKLTISHHFAPFYNIPTNIPTQAQLMSRYTLFLFSSPKRLSCFPNFSPTGHMMEWSDATHLIPRAKVVPTYRRSACLLSSAYCTVHHYVHYSPLIGLRGDFRWHIRWYWRAWPLGIFVGIFAFPPTCKLAWP